MSSIHQFAIMIKPSAINGWLWFILLDDPKDDDKSDMVCTGFEYVYIDAATEAFKKMQEIKEAQDAME